MDVINASPYASYCVLFDTRLPALQQPNFCTRVAFEELVYTRIFVPLFIFAKTPNENGVNYRALITGAKAISRSICMRFIETSYDCSL